MDGSRQSDGGGRAPDLGALLRQLEPRAARALLLPRLCREVAAFLGLDVAAVAPQQGFTTLGFDSLRAVDFRGRLEAMLGLDLRSTLLFDQPDCDRLCDFLLAQLGPGAATAATTAAAPPAPGPREPIAIVGMACRFPGPASDVAAFWRLLDTGQSAVGDVPPGRWPMDLLYDPDPAAPGRIYTRRGGFLPAIDQFDAAFFGISPVEATMLDPQQRLLLEVAWETLEDAGLPAERLADLTPGVFIGMRASEYFQSQCARLPEDADAWYATGNAISTAAGRLSYFFGFRGPCFALDTACSGSLVALHEAVQSLRRGECRAALAGGVNTLVDPLSSVGLCRARMLSPDGRCKVFDAAADGYVRGEGCGLVLLVTLAEARRLGLPVHAVIRGSAINQDGRTAGLTVPHGPSQEAVIRSALADAGLQPDDIDYVEAHGTGTALGDPIEVGSLDAVFVGRRARGASLRVGSVKTNVGHLEAAAGISGLLKVVLALQHERLPAHLHFVTPNPHIDWRRTEVEVLRDRVAWPRGARPRRAGVSSFGFSGTNAHVVLEEGDGPPPPRPAPRARHAVVLSARTAGSLRRHAARWAAVLAAPGAPALHDVAFTAGVGREHLQHRLGVVAPDTASLAATLAAFADGDAAESVRDVVAGVAARTPPRVAFLFSGQGAQRAGAGRELYEQEPVFRAAIDRCARVFDRLRDRALPDVLFGDDQDLLTRTDYTQPALFALQFALSELWRAFGVTPSVVLGHSVGEIAAAAAAGVLSCEDGLRLCAARGALMVQHCRPGAMLVVFAGADDVIDRLGALPPTVAIAAMNGPAETVLSGEGAAIEALGRGLAAVGVRSQPLQVSHAFHSPLMAPMLAPFERFLARVEFAAPRLRLVSCRSGADGEVATAAHWCRHVAEPVAFHEALAAAAAVADVLVEIGPAPVLLGLAARALPAPMPSFASLRKGVPERTQLLTSVVELHVRGVPIDFLALTASDAGRRVSLPSQPFDRQRFWLRQQAMAMRIARHPLLGALLPNQLLGPGQRLYEAVLTEREPAWLGDHRVHERALLPFAAVLECALAAGTRAWPELARESGALPGALELRDVAIAAPLWLAAEPTVTQWLIDGGDGAAAFRLCRQDGEAWPVHATGTVARQQGAWPLPFDEAAGERLDVAAFYAGYERLGLAYGPAFQVVTALQRSGRAASGEIRLPVQLLPELPAFVVHPALLDGCLQVAGATVDGPPGTTWLPVGLERLVVARAAPAGAVCSARCRAAAGPRTRTIDLQARTRAGELWLAIEGLQLLAAEPGQFAAGDAGRWLHGIHWQRQPRAAGGAAATGLWIVTARERSAGAGALAAALATALEPHGGSACALPLRDAEAALEAQVAGVVFDATAPLSERADRVATELMQLARLARAMAARPAPARLCVLTDRAQAADVLDQELSPHGAALWGLLRVVALEHPELRPIAIDRDAHTDLEALVAELLAGEAAGQGAADQGSDDPGREDQVAFRHDQRLVPRLHAGLTAPDELLLPDGPFQVRCLEYGRLDRLAAEALPPVEPRAGEVVIEVAAAGLNFKDVLHALGLLRPFSEARGIRAAREQPLGFECAGRITATGDGVRDLAVGDAVLAMAEGALGSRVVAPASHVARVPPGIELAAAAGLPTGFATALYALEHVAAVQPGEMVLVHAAAGGVGLAALQVCRRRGAEVFATSSAGKAAFLRAQGIVHWAESRGSDFTAAVRAVRPGGVDVVLNCLEGDAIARSADLLRPGGRFVEIGKRAIWTPEQMAARRPDVQYRAFDLAELAAADPGLLPGLLRELVAGLADGSLRAGTTARVPVQRAPALFAAMAKGRHVGKLVLTMPTVPAIRADRTYLITGGTGAVGRAAASELVARGARHVALLAREPVDDEQIAALRTAAEVRVFAADVGDPDTMADVIPAVRESMPPVAGVVHAAGVLRDALLADLDLDDLAAVLRPKVDGVQNLDALLDNDSLDFFAATTSMAGWLGNQGQAGYAAANAWLEAFCAARWLRGRRAVAVAFGPWSQSGMAARMTARERARLVEIGVDLIPPAAGAAALVQLAFTPLPRVGVMAMRWPAFRRQFVGATPPLLRALLPAAKATAEGDAGALAQALAALPPGERLSHLRAEVRRLCAAVLGFADPDGFDAGRTFGELGVDSLLAVELRTRLGRTLALSLPATLLFDHPDLDRLTEHLAALLPPASARPPTAVAAAVAAGDAEAALARALEQQVQAMEQRP